MRSARSIRRIRPRRRRRSSRRSGRTSTRALTRTRSRRFARSGSGGRGWIVRRARSRRCSTWSSIASSPSSTRSRSCMTSTASTHSHRATPNGATSPTGTSCRRRYRAALEDACVVASSRGCPLWAPALSNLDRDSLALARGRARRRLAGWAAWDQRASLRRRDVRAPA